MTIRTLRSLARTNDSKAMCVGNKDDAFPTSELAEGQRDFSEWRERPLHRIGLCQHGNQQPCATWLSSLVTEIGYADGDDGTGTKIPTDRAVGWDELGTQRMLISKDTGPAVSPLGANPKEIALPGRECLTPRRTVVLILQASAYTQSTDVCLLLLSCL